MSMATYRPRVVVRLLQWRRRAAQKREASICGWKRGWDYFV